MVFAIPTVVLAFLALRLKEPVRGRYEREAAGADVASTTVISPISENSFFSPIRLLFLNY